MLMIRLLNVALTWASPNESTFTILFLAAAFGFVAVVVLLPF